MDILGKIVLGIVLFAITSIIAYLFRMRQLYLAVSKLYRHAALADKGSITELVIYNKGNHVEEDILIQIDPNLKGQLLASSTTDLKMHDSTITINRLHTASDISLVLLVEHGVLEKNKIFSFTSKATKGLVVDKVESVPPNYAKFFLIILSLCLMPVPTFYIDSIISTYNHFKYSSSYERLSLEGWSDLDSYLTSDLKMNYQEDEFPFRFLSKHVNSYGETIAVFNIFNKSAHTMKVFSDVANKRMPEDSADLTYFSSAEVPPMSKGTINVKVPPSGKSELSISLAHQFIGFNYTYAH